MKNKVLSFLLSLAISFGLWLYVVTVISPESEAVFFDIPVELVGNDYLNNQNLMVISSTDNLRVDLTVEGKRSDLNKLSNSNITVIADLSKITRAGEHKLDCSVSFPSGSAEVLKQEPNKITVVVAEKLTKNIPVKINCVGSVAEGYEEERDSISLDHTTVTISGPKETIEKIGSAKIVVDLTGKMTTFVGNYPLTLCGLDGSPIADVSFVNTNLSTVRAVVQVNRVKIVPVNFILDYTDSGLQEGMATSYSTVKTVTLIGNSEDLEKVEDALEFTVFLKDYEGTSTKTIVPSLPDGVRCKEEIMVHITMPEMDYRVLTVSRFEFINVPDGMTVETAEAYEVKVWGPSVNLEQISEDAVIATVDCSNIKLNSGYAPVKYQVETYEYMHVISDWDNVLIKVQPVEE